MIGRGAGVTYLIAREADETLTGVAQLAEQPSRIRRADPALSWPTTAKLNKSSRGLV